MAVARPSNRCRGPDSCPSRACAERAGCAIHGARTPSRLLERACLETARWFDGVVAKPFLLAAGVLLVSANSFALMVDDINIQVEPIVGYEFFQNPLPTPHLTSRLLYGARATAGYRILSGEGEYTYATSSETFATQDTTDSTEKLKIGLRSGYALGSVLGVTVRAGAQAALNRHTDVFPDGSTSSFTQPIDVKPYAGLDFDASLSGHLAATLGLLVVFHDLNDLSQNEYQLSGGVALRF